MGESMEKKYFMEANDKHLGLFLCEPLLLFRYLFFNFQERQRPSSWHSAKERWVWGGGCWGTGISASQKWIILVLRSGFVVVSAPFCLPLLLCLGSTSCSEGEACWSRRYSHASCGLSFSEYIVFLGHLSPSPTFGMKEMSLLSELSHLFNSHFIPSHHSQAILRSILRNIVCSNLWSDGRARVSRLGLNIGNPLGPSLF